MLNNCLRRVGALSLVSGLLLSISSLSAFAGPYESGIEAYLEKDYGQAIKYWSNADLAGNARALFGLGVLYIRGMGTGQDLVKGVEFYKQAAALGYSSAQFNLGLAYYMRRGVEHSPEQAKSWWHKAAIQDHPAAQYNLAAVLWSGKGIEQDQATAMKWFRAALSNGSVEAAEFLNALYEPMYQELVDLGKTERDSNSNRNIPLVEEIGMYKLGRQAIEQGDPKQAFGYWFPLAEDGHSDSQYQIARLYEQGTGTEKDFLRAMGWYQKAAEGGQADAQYRIGMYQINESEDKNPSLGLYWIQSAADGGSESALEYLESIR